MPPTTTQHRTTLSRHEATGFEDRPLATEVMLALWTGILAGGVIAAGGFDDPRPLHNGVVRLVALVGTAAVLGLGLKATSRRVAWRLQFGVFASLLAHSLLLAAFWKTELLTIGSAAAPASEREEPRELVIHRAVKIVPTPERRPEVFEQPVVAETPPEVTVELPPLVSTPTALAEVRAYKELSAPPRQQSTPDVTDEPRRIELAHLEESPLDIPAAAIARTPMLAAPALAEFPRAKSLAALASQAPRAEISSAPARVKIELAATPRAPSRLAEFKPDRERAPTEVTSSAAVAPTPRIRLTPLPRANVPAPMASASGLPDVNRTNGAPARVITPELSASKAPPQRLARWNAAATAASVLPNGGASDITKVASTAKLGPPTLGSLARQELAPFAGSGSSPLATVTIPARSAPRALPTLAGTSPRRTATAFNRKSRRAGLGADPTDRARAAKTESAIEAGLRYLAPLQQADGRWSFRQLGPDVPRDEIPSVEADGAATGLVLLAMLGAGYDHLGDTYQQPLRRGLEYLVKSQQPSGLLFPEEGQSSAWGVARFYSHGIATIALCETYGMTGDPDLRAPAQKALDYIARSQVPELGGWRYTPGVNSDLSVSGWQLMALRSGELAGLRVDPTAYRRVRQFVDRCREATGSRARFCYNPTAPVADPRMNHGRLPGTVMTSVGLLAQLYLGETRTDRRMQQGAEHLCEHLPQSGATNGLARISTLGNPLRDTYYWYYATQVMFHMRGEYWESWNNALHPLLVESQVPAGPLAGSWDPLRPTPDRWAGVGGRMYVTALNLLSLEVYYRHLPLYETVAK